MAESLSQEMQEEILKKLQNRIGKDTQISNSTIGDNILASSSETGSQLSNTILNAKNLSLAKSEQDYADHLAIFLVNLACSDSVIAQGIISFQFNIYESYDLIKETTAIALLARKNDTSRQCTGLTNLGSHLLNDLESCSKRKRP